MHQPSDRSAELPHSATPPLSRFQSEPMLSNLRLPSRSGPIRDRLRRDGFGDDRHEGQSQPAN